MKKLFSLALALGLSLSLAACGGDADPTPTPVGDPNVTPDAQTVTLTVGATAVPHADILNQVVDVLAEQGIELKVVEYNDYVIPNTAVEEGELDANFFQHITYMNDFNAERGTHLVSVADIHYEPYGIYPCKVKSLDELPDGAVVGVPNDVTNEARALLLLQDEGLITLREGAGLAATPNDIVNNPKNLEFLELEAAMVPSIVSDVDIAAINGNYALQAGFSSVADALIIEDAQSESAQTYRNVLVTKEGREDDPAIQALVAALTSDAMRDYINDTYYPNVIPLF